MTIIGVLIALLLPAIHAARSAARRTQCSSNLRQIALAVSQFHDTFAIFPPGRIDYRFQDEPSRVCGGFEPTWTAYVLPFVEEQAAADRWRLLEDYSLHDAQTREYAPSVYACPERGANRTSTNELRIVSVPCGCGGGEPQGYRPTGATAHYAGNHGDGSPGYAANDDSAFFWGGNGTGVLITVRARCAGIWPVYPVALHDTVRAASVTDGLSKTVLLGEMHTPEDDEGIVPDNGPMYDGKFLPSSLRLGGVGLPIARGPTDAEAPRMFDEHAHYGFGSRHAGVCHFALADGSVQAFAVDTDEALLGQRCHRSDGDVQPTSL